MGAVRIPVNQGGPSGRIVSKEEGSQKTYLQAYIYAISEYFYGSF
jgi:hypothetical protein